jgi:hypothetical protein
MSEYLATSEHNPKQRTFCGLTLPDRLIKKDFGHYLYQSAATVVSYGLEKSKENITDIVNATPIWMQSSAFGTLAFSITNSWVVGAVTAGAAFLNKTNIRLFKNDGLLPSKRYLNNSEIQTSRRQSARLGTAIVGGLLAARLAFGAFSDNGDDTTSSPTNQPNAKAQNSLTIN